MVEWTYRSTETHPQKFDVVWCWFPQIENLRAPGPKARPALVRARMRVAGKPWLELVYGTSRITKAADHAFIVSNMVEMNDAGLPQATAFDLKRVVQLPWSEDFFCERESDGKGPVVGKFSTSMRIELTRHALYWKDQGVL